MRRVSAIVYTIALALAAAHAAAADAPAYNKTDTFEPGKKYTCVPTADHKNWECNEAGKAAPRAPDVGAPSPTTAATSAVSEPPQVASPPPAAPARSSTLPSYLTNAAAESPAQPASPPSTISATANHANAPAPETFAPPPPSHPAPAAAVSPPKPAPRASAVVPTKSVKSETPRSTVSPPTSTATTGGAFLDLPGDRFVIELAHASTQSALTDARSAIHVPRGDVYEVHLGHSGADTWLLLWGTFDNLDAARAARGQLAQTTSAALGFPRRIAPLQAEARRISE